MRTGAKAAELLNSAIIQHLVNVDFVPSNMHIVVKVFADTGKDHDRVYPFAASFSVVCPFCNYTPVSHAGMVKIKVEDNFELLRGDKNCKYILLAVNHEATYTDLLSPSKDSIDIGLLHAGPIHVDYQLLCLRSVVFKNIFFDQSND